MSTQRYVTSAEFVAEIFDLRACPKKDETAEAHQHISNEDGEWWCRCIESPQRGGLERVSRDQERDHGGTTELALFSRIAL